MKKVLVGCAIVIVIAIIGFGVAGYYTYRAMRPMIDNAASYIDKARIVERLGDAVTNKAPFTPPATGELTSTQVERFLAVQTRVRSELGDKWDEVEKKSAAIKARTDKDRNDWTLAEFTQVFNDIANIWIEARRAQVNALNVQKFSEAEYQWVRMRVYEAAGVHLAGNLNLSMIEELARENASKTGIEVPQMELPKIPEKNIELVKPHAAKIQEWIPMAALGL
ncbi:MAG TPA: hypothetical protein VFZ31_00590 [Vicinamibacterales bacterium]